MIEIIKKLTSILAAKLTTPIFIKLARETNRIHLNVDEIFYIASVIKGKAPCRLLVFGFGNDSYFWTKLNKGGKTIFLEDDPVWFDQVKKQNPQCYGYLVDYGTQRSEWQELIGEPDKLRMDLPEEVEMEKFDCILIDGPHGWVDTDPGRMKSIFEASRLIETKGDIFVHDSDREVEKAYCDRYLGHGILKKGLPRLRHYILDERKE